MICYINIQNYARILRNKLGNLKMSQGLITLIGNFKINVLRKG